MKCFRGIALSLLLLCSLSGCDEEKSPGTLTLTVSGNYAEDFTAGGWATARLTATAVDAEGKSLPVEGNIVWWVQTADIHDKVVAWNGDRHDGSGLLWGESPFSRQTASGPDNFPREATAFLTDTVGSRTVTVMAKLRIPMPPEDPRKGWRFIIGRTTFTFGDGPISLFSAPPCQVASREEAERYCATFPSAAQQGGETAENGLPPATLLQLVSNNRINGYGAALAAGWPGEFEKQHIYSYWARETDRNGKDGRVVNVKDGLALWYDAKVPELLAVCAPKNIPAPPAPVMPPEKAALRAEAEEMLLPQRPGGLSPLPDIWKLRCNPFVPDDEDAPLYYGTPPLAEYNNGYAPSMAISALEQPIFSKEEILSFDPSTFPQPVISEPQFSLEGDYDRDTRISSLESRYTPTPLWFLIRHARKGAPKAMLAIGRRFSKYSPSRYFWWRLADSMTCPGWAYVEENGESIDPSLRGLLGDPRDMIVMEYPSLDDAIREPVAGAPDRRYFYRELMRECALRGQAFAWAIWAHMYAYNTAGSNIPKGFILDKSNPTRGYAMVLAERRLLRDYDNSRNGYRTVMLDWETLRSRLPSRLFRYPDDTLELIESQLKKDAVELGINEAKAQALAEELFAVYQENYQRVLEQQRRRRVNMLPEVNRQIDGWLKDMEIRNPQWLKKEWPSYPADD